jgi:hypothetical protein
MLRLRLAVIPLLALGCVGSVDDSGDENQNAQDVITNVDSWNDLELLRNSAPLSVTRSGSGTVMSSPVGINCGTTCTARFRLNTNVVLTATPAAGFTFAGWSGACSGTSLCSLTINQAKSVTATFTPTAAQQARLTVELVDDVTCAPYAYGTIVTSPGGLSCSMTAGNPKICTATFPVGTVVSLSATPGSLTSFLGYSAPGCSVSSCNVPMNGDQGVRATFCGLIQ